MFKIRYATENDRRFWYSLDKHLREEEFVGKIRDKRGYIICDDETSTGILRYNLFWDDAPFLTLIYVEEAHRKKGFGKKAMLHWENEMRNLGHKMVMTSTQADERAQHFYRKLGYMDRGSLILDNTPYEQPLEIIMVKVL